MHPSISSFPSRMFYNSRLTDAPSLNESRNAVWHKSPLFRPFTFFDVYRGKEFKSSASSTFNDEDVDVCLNLVKKLFRDCQDVDVIMANKFSGRIGIISFYKEQVRRLRNKFNREFGAANAAKFFDINTVDGFQGQEKDIVILSCVRASKTYSQTSRIGFLADKRRINVALTRARFSLLVLGHHRTLANDELWSGLVNTADDLGLSRKISSNE